MSQEKSLKRATFFGVLGALAFLITAVPPLRLATTEGTAVLTGEFGMPG